MAKLQKTMSSKAVAERNLEEKGSDVSEKLVTNKVKHLKVNVIRIENNMKGLLERPKQLKSADVAVHNSTLWRGTCNKRCSGETAMAAHLNGRKHKTTLQKTMSSKAVAGSYLEETRFDVPEKLIANKVLIDRQVQLPHHSRLSSSAVIGEIPSPDLPWSWYAIFVIDIMGMSGPCSGYVATLMFF
ncbi:uncharacterized protein LOC107802075 isoform X3 [Nicotiana tabacum]|uniref:Uncharacterized protein LOC107802075 isoform X3 n=1 Tax=Nicotiana tabacum TaxID=4097 RepID=A0AC58T767_TOBAC